MATKPATSLPIQVSHVADHCRRYPGEPVTLFTRVEAVEALSGFTLTITLSRSVIVEAWRMPAAFDESVPAVMTDDESTNLTWQVDADIAAGTRVEYQVDARVLATTSDLVVKSSAKVSPGRNSPEAQVVAPLVAAESASIAVAVKSQYLNYIPALYQGDDFMGRFLMLFESFLMPVERQVGNLALYFDPKLTPVEFLPWLASWLNLVLDEHLPVERRRQLLQASLSLYRKRGTRQGLRKTLQIYTNREVGITEHRANNFQIGPYARLGPGMALGQMNEPHTFDVIIHRSPEAEAPGDDSDDQAWLQRTVEARIEAEMPAHTVYTLRFE